MSPQRSAGPKPSSHAGACDLSLLGVTCKGVSTGSSTGRSGCTRRVTSAFTAEMGSRSASSKRWHRLSASHASVGCISRCRGCNPMAPSPRQSTQRRAARAVRRHLWICRFPLSKSRPGARCRASSPASAPDSLRLSCSSMPRARWEAATTMRRRWWTSRATCCSGSSASCPSRPLGQRGKRREAHGSQRSRRLPERTRSPRCSSPSRLPSSASFSRSAGRARPSRRLRCAPSRPAV
mmetsp:Transcript_40586/g.118323  ORF Transcript_40586/g.118323 Transcript_40586/m.118323 type:complete len:237 (+) Transcript_40586:811-1521(+)